jgi:Protein of unknown function (DUF3618)
MSTSSTNLGNRSAAEIEAEVNHERERVADTIGALHSKLSVKSLVDEMRHAVAEHGGEIAAPSAASFATIRCRRS